MRARARKTRSGKEGERTSGVAKDRAKNEKDRRIGVAEMEEREEAEKEEDRERLPLDRGGKARGIRSTIHRAVALAPARRFATPLPRSRHTHTNTHVYTCAPSGLLLINNALRSPHYN